MPSLACSLLAVELSLPSGSPFSAPLWLCHSTVVHWATQKSDKRPPQHNGVRRTVTYVEAGHTQHNYIRLGDRDMVS
jgi:hypothetical protein